MIDLIFKILLYLAMSILGSGMLGQLIMFFIKRNDEKKKKRMESYRDFYDKLSAYYADINRFLLNLFSKKDACALMYKDKMTETEQWEADVDKLLKYVKKLKRACGKNGYIDKDNCIACSNARKQLQETDESFQQNLEEMRLLLQRYKSYWKDNKDKIKELVDRNINQYNYLLASGKKKENIITAVGEIDELSFQILEEQNNEQKCLSLLTNQMSKIEVALHLLAKKMEI